MMLDGVDRLESMIPTSFTDGSEQVEQVEHVEHAEPPVPAASSAVAVEASSFSSASPPASATTAPPVEPAEVAYASAGSQEVPRQVRFGAEATKGATKVATKAGGTPSKPLKPLKPLKPAKPSGAKPSLLAAKPAKPSGAKPGGGGSLRRLAMHHLSSCDSPSESASSPSHEVSDVSGENKSQEVSFLSTSSNGTDRSINLNGNGRPKSISRGAVRGTEAYRISRKRSSSVAGSRRALRAGA